MEKVKKFPRAEFLGFIVSAKKCVILNTSEAMEKCKNHSIFLKLHNRNLFVMASFTIKLNNTFQDTFINVLDAKINNLKDIIVNEIGIDETNDEIPESEDNSIENNQMRA